MHKIHLLARLQQRNTTLGHLNWPVYSTFLNHASANWFKRKLFVLLDQVSKPETFIYTYFILILYLPICISPPPRGQFTCGPNFLLWLNKNIQGFLNPFIDPITHSHSFVITHSQLWGLFCCFKLSSSASHLPFGDYIWTTVSKNIVTLTLPHDARSQLSHPVPYDFKQESHSLIPDFESGNGH